MSFDIFVRGFSDGDAAEGDGRAAMEVIEPLIVERGDDWARIATGDGDADVYGIDSASSGFMFNHISGTDAFTVIYEVARRAGFVVMPVGCRTCVTSHEQSEHLPLMLAEDVAVIASGDDLKQTITTA